MDLFGFEVLGFGCGYVIFLEVVGRLDGGCCCSESMEYWSLLIIVGKCDVIWLRVGNMGLWCGR